MGEKGRIWKIRRKWEIGMVSLKVREMGMGEGNGVQRILGMGKLMKCERNGK